MFQLKCWFTLIVALFLNESNQQIVIPNVYKCNLVCGDENLIDIKTCSCVHNTQSNRENVREIRSPDNPLISKLISVDKHETRTSRDRCYSDEYWNGRSCIPLISLCPGGYHWNGDSCITQSSIIQTAALIQSPSNTNCALRAKLANEHHSNIQRPSTVMPTYSTSPMCPFGLIWNGDKCIRVPPVCPNGYKYRDNICYLIETQPFDTIETTTLPPLGDIFEKRVRNGEKWQQKPFNTDSNLGFISGTDSSTDSSETNDNKIIKNDQNHQHCCLIMSPRICRRIKNSQDERWQCYHQTNRQCNEFCTKPNIYLRPKKFSYIDSTLIMPPPPRRLQKLMQNSVYRETNIGKKSN